MTTKEVYKNSEAIPEEIDQSLEKKRRYKFWTFLFLVILFCGVFYFIWMFFQGPAVGVIRPGVALKKEDSFNQGTEIKHFTGTYFSFSYPGVYVEKSHTLPETGPVRETLFLSASDVEGKKIAVTVEERDSNILDASPSFQMRQRDTKIYKKSSLQWKGLDRPLFTKDSQVFEKTVFLQENSFILIISVSSPFSSETLSGDLENIFESLQWKTKE